MHVCLLLCQLPDYNCPTGSTVTSNRLQIHPVNDVWITFFHPVGLISLWAYYQFKNNWS